MVERHARPKAAPPCIRFGVWERLAYAWRICKGLVGGLEGYNPIEFSWAYSKIWDLGLCIAAGIEHKQFLVICFFVYILAPHDLFFHSELNVDTAKTCDWSMRGVLA